MRLVRSYTYNDEKYFAMLLDKENLTKDQKEDILRDLNTTNDNYTIEMYRDDKDNVFVQYKLNGKNISKREIGNNFITSKLGSKIDKWIFE